MSTSHGKVLGWHSDLAQNRSWAILGALKRVKKGKSGKLFLANFLHALDWFWLKDEKKKNWPVRPRNVKICCSEFAIFVRKNFFFTFFKLTMWESLKFVFWEKLLKKWKKSKFTATNFYVFTFSLFTIFEQFFSKNKLKTFSHS